METLVGLDPFLQLDVCRKTGNYKRFSVFVEMLLSALHKTSDTVVLDILTPSDLSNKPHDYPPLTMTIQQEPKIYLILKYAVAFDRILYPLPLQKKMTQNDDRLLQSKMTQNDDRLLQSEIDHLKHVQQETAIQIQQLREENKKLKKSKEKRNDFSIRHLKRFADNCVQDVLEICYRTRMDHKHVQMIRRKLQALMFEIEQSESLPMRSLSLDNVPRLERKKHESPNVNRLRETSPYKIIKSEPLLAPKEMKRSTSARSSSPFKRFDPTAYVQEQNRKRSERKRESSVSSIRSVASTVQSWRSNGSEKAFRQSQQSLKSNYTQKSNYSQSSQQLPVKKTKRKCSKKQVSKVLDQEEEDAIGQRLETLQRYLESLAVH